MALTLQTGEFSINEMGMVRGNRTQARKLCRRIERTGRTSESMGNVEDGTLDMGHFFCMPEVWEMFAYTLFFLTFSGSSSK